MIKRYRKQLTEPKDCNCGDETTSACSQVLTHSEMLHLVQSLPPGPEWGNSGDNVRIGKILDQALRQATSQKELLMNQEAQQLQVQIGSLDNFAPQQPPFVDGSLDNFAPQQPPFVDGSLDNFAPQQPPFVYGSLDDFAPQQPPFARQANLFDQIYHSGL